MLTPPALLKVVPGTPLATYSYIYDNLGNITQIKKDGVIINEYTYDYLGQLVCEEDAVAGVTYIYYYDDSGIAAVSYDGTKYYYVKNLQGDVIGLVNASGQYVVQYVYDAWGRVVSTTGSMASTLGQYNPFRYRSYYYDRETGWYYLQSRYYDPTVGRFLNADKYASTGIGILGCNMFAYCNNNPISYIDINGSEPASATAGVALGAAGVVLTIFVVVAFFDYEAATDFVVGAIDLVESLVDTVVGAFSAVSSTTAIQTVTESADVGELNAEEAKGIIESVLIEKLTNYEGTNKSSHVHHIVAQHDKRASAAKIILEELLPGGVNNTLNLITVKQPVHQRLHTNVYYSFVNMVICKAYESAGLDKDEQRKNVIKALMDLRVFIKSLNACCPE